MSGLPRMSMHVTVPVYCYIVHSQDITQFHRFHILYMILGCTPISRYTSSYQDFSYQESTVRCILFHSQLCFVVRMIHH